MGFVVILCKYGLLLKKKPFSMSMREVVWTMNFDSLLEPDPYVDVDDVMGVMIPIDEEEMWTMNLPLEVRISWVM